MSGVKVGIGTLVGMRLRRVSPRKVIGPLIKAHKAGLNLTTNQLESHYLAGGNVDRVVDANIALNVQILTYHSNVVPIDLADVTFLKQFKCL